MADDSGAYVAITRLQATYGDVCMRQAWAEMADLCAPGATFSYDLGTGPEIELDGPDQLCAFGKRALSQFDFYQYTPLTTVITIDDDGTAVGRLHVLEVGTLRSGGAWTESYGRYDDQYVLTDGVWTFARRSYHARARRTTTA